MRATHSGREEERMITSKEERWASMGKAFFGSLFLVMAFICALTGYALWAVSVFLVAIRILYSAVGSWFNALDIKEEEAN